MGFFKFMKKKGTGGEHKDLNSEMTMEDIPPAPIPFEMGGKPPGPNSTPLGNADFPDVPNLRDDKEAVELPIFPETLGPEITAPPRSGLKVKTPSAEKTFEDIPFPGIKRVDDHPEHKDPFPTEIRRAAPVPHEHIVSPPLKEPSDIVPQPIYIKKEPKVISPPPLIPVHKVEPPHIEKHEIVEEHKEEIHPFVQEIHKEPVEDVPEEGVEFKYLKERTNVDFSKPLFLDSDQCNRILDGIDYMRRGLGECNKSYDHLTDLRSKSDKQFQKLHAAVEEVQKKLFNADKILFNQ